MHLGLIVGIGPAATDYYYRSLIGRMMAAQCDLELTMAHADTATLLANQAAGNVPAQVGIYDRLARRLAAAGAHQVAVTSIAGHFCIEEFERLSPLPVVDILSVVNDAVQARGYRRVGLLGTRGVMESRFYGALRGLEAIAPPGAALEDVHEAYVAMASTARCTDEQRSTFFDAGRAMVEERGAQAVLLAGTDLGLAFNGFDPGFAVFDCAKAHVDALTAVAKAS
ncbi:aspartate/glutamate racemase family protein [Pengzhenrongella phosphoraccumulans]|uniref:aspartate/glutamate racemase family protein n=1 Tax=Pengzhenrongella phosphoraccumulans TaxID=3114394 RepID=UPI00388E1E9F